MSMYRAMLVMCSGSALTLALIVWRRTPVIASMVLSLFFACVSWSSLAYAMELSAGDLKSALFWNHTQYAGGMFLPPLMLLLALVATGRFRKPYATQLVLLFAIPLLSIVANLSNEWHHLYYHEVWMDTDAAVPVLAKSRGPLYPVNFAYVYLLMFATLGMTIQSLRKAASSERRPLWLLLTAFILPLVFNIPYTFRFMPYRHINLTLLGFFCSSILIAFGLFRYRLLHAIPLNAEERSELLMNHAGAILYFIRPDGTFSYISPNIRDLLGAEPETTVDSHFSDYIHPEDHEQCGRYLAQVVAGEKPPNVVYRAIHSEGSTYWHSTRIRPVRNKAGHVIAYAGVAHDVTELKQTQEKLHDANRKLFQLIDNREAELREAMEEALTAAESEARRIGESIHDELCHELIFLARLTESVCTLSEDCGPACREAFVQIHEQAAKLTDAARAYSHDLALYELDVQSLPDALDTLSRRAQQVFDTEVEINTGSDLLSLSDHDTNHIYRIIREAVANANRHAQARHIWIDIIREKDLLVISITNDGVPLPPADAWTPGLGMRQIQMRTRLLGGDFSLSSQPDGKTIAELTVPYREKELP